MGGSVQQLPNTCEPEKKNTGYLTVEISIMITKMQSPRFSNSWINVPQFD